MDSEALCNCSQKKEGELRTMNNFRSYQLALNFYRAVIAEINKLPSHLRDQMQRASSSICLNLAEGWGKQTNKDRKKFFQIAFGSLRECQSILDMHPLEQNIHSQADHLAASIYKLLRNAP